MNRNANSRFAYTPSVNIGRSKFPMKHSLKTSWNVGDVIPVFCEEILPGDTMNMKTNILARMQTLVAPVMDNIYLDTYYFFVPNRLVWSHWKDFMGENTQSAWLPETEYSIPQLKSPEGGWNVGTLADYFGIPTGVSNLSVNALPFRAYSLIMQDWFRSEVVTDPLNIPTGDAATEGSNGSNYIDDVVAGGKPFRAAKFFDVFSGATPSPQKGPTVELNIASGTQAPVVGNGLALGLSNGSGLAGLQGINSTTTTSITSAQEYGQPIGTVIGAKTDGLTGALGVATVGQLGDDLSKSGLVANISGTGIISINELREAFQIQKFYEKQALYGSRYIEIIKSMFNVTSPDARMQRPEYLGGHRLNVNVNQVVQTSSSDDTTPQGNTAAYSLTVDSHGDFSHSFTEHGYVIGLVVARYDHTYQQGLDKTFLRKTKFDYYWPVFANLGNQALTNNLIYAQGSEAINPQTGKAYDDEVFGYQEAWYDYRYKPNRVTGEMRSQYQTSLDVWHLGDYYESLPHLSDEWIREDKSNIDRALVVTSEVSNQMFGDFYFDCTMVRPMPLYSIPGLIDHN